MHPVMNSIRKDIELNPYADRSRQKQAKGLSIDQRPLDNDTRGKANPYAVDGW